jgi:hypothetical protein
MDPTRLLAAVIILGLWLLARGEGARATPLILRHDPPSLAQQSGPQAVQQRAVQQQGVQQQ